jgi:ribokinase
VTEIVPRLLVGGAINTDLVVRVTRAPDAGETVTGRSFAVFGGGKGANQAFAAARSGANVAMLGALGRDDFGRQRLRDLEAEGIDVDSVAVADGASSGVALIFVDDAGQNRIAYVPGATATVTAEQAVAALRRCAPRVVLTTLELPAPSLEALYQEARRIGALVITNATPEPSAGTRLVAAADVVITNETEAAELLGEVVAGQDWEHVAQRLRAIGPSVAIVTLGAAGAVVVGDGVARRIPAPTVSAVDSTGAGDAFCGAFAARLAAGASPLEAAASGVAAGSISVTRPGAQPSMPRRDEIEAMVAGTQNSAC